MTWKNSRFLLNMHNFVNDQFFSLNITFSITD